MIILVLQKSSNREDNMKLKIIDINQRMTMIQID